MAGNPQTIDPFAPFRRILDEYLIERGAQGQRDLAETMVRIGYPKPTLVQQDISYWLKHPHNLLKLAEGDPSTTRLDWVLRALGLTQTEKERLVWALVMGEDRGAWS